MDLRTLYSNFIQGNITLKDVKCYLQGYWRWFIIERTPFSFLVPSSIKAEIETRQLIAHCNTGDFSACPHCGCDLPQVYYCDKACLNDCYPKMGSIGPMTSIEKLKTIMEVDKERKKLIEQYVTTAMESD